MKDEELLQHYLKGYQLSMDDLRFPVWFESDAEKQACLLGYCDCDFGIFRENEEIIDQIKKVLK